MTSHNYSQSTYPSNGPRTPTEIAGLMSRAWLNPWFFLKAGYETRLSLGGKHGDLLFRTICLDLCKRRSNLRPVSKNCHQCWKQQHFLHKNGWLKIWKSSHPKLLRPSFISSKSFQDLGVPANKVWVNESSRWVDLMQLARRSFRQALASYSRLKIYI